MKKAFARKPISVLLSLLMVLSVFGGIPLTASAEDNVFYLYCEDEAAAIAGRTFTGSQSCTVIDDTAAARAERFCAFA